MQLILFLLLLLLTIVLFYFLFDSLSSSSASDASSGTPQSQEDRILKHMNSQHQPSLTRYLEHRHRLSSFASRAPVLTAISTSALTIRARPLISPKVYYNVPFVPPLADLSETRARLVAMDEAAMKALRRSPDTVTRYLPPNGPVQIVASAAVLFGFACLSRKENFLPDSWLTGTILAPAPPAFARLLYRFQWLGLSLMIGIHAVEAAVMITSRLRKHTVPVGSNVWMMWVLSAFFEGYGALMRFDAEVDQLKAKREKGH